MTRAELETQIAAYMHRTDLTGDIPGFIDFATVRIGRMLQSASNEAVANLVVTTNPTPLPLDYARMRSVTQAQTGGDRTIFPVGSARFNHFGSSGVSAVYHIQGKLIEFAPLGAGTYVLDYFQIPAALTSGASTNQVLEDLPFLYLYASLVEANIFVQDPEQSNAMLAIFTAEVEDENRRTSAANAGGMPAVHGV